MTSSLTIHQRRETQQNENPFVSNNIREQHRDAGREEKKLEIQREMMPKKNQALGFA